MGCGFSSPKSAIANGDIEPQTLQEIDYAIDYNVAVFRRYGKKDPNNPRVWIAFIKTAELMRKRGSLLQNAACYDGCIELLQGITEDDAFPSGSELKNMALHQMSLAKRDRFNLSKDVKDIDEAINYSVQYAKQSQKSDLDTAVALAFMLKTYCETQAEAVDLLMHTWYLENIWPKIATAKIGVESMKYLGYLWRMNYLESGSFGCLQVCNAITLACFNVSSEVDPAEQEQIFKDLIELEMIAYFFPEKPMDDSDRVMPASLTQIVQPLKEGYDASEADRQAALSSQEAGIYQSLGHRDIRLLELLPGDFQSPIRCRLLVKSLDANPVFEVSFCHTLNNS
jgi:hypothetical protein